MRRILCVSLVNGLAGVMLTLAGTEAIAQPVILPDGTLGPGGSEVMHLGSVDEIGGGVVRGPNVFHSFSEFGVAEGRSAYFLLPSSEIETILARVTGGNRSDILGTLGVRGTADLFLLNPNGIVFGPEARLDISGSFLATTAESFNFGDGLQFNAINPGAAPLLTVNVSSGLQLGEMGDGAISSSIDGSLAVGGDLKLVSPDLRLQGELLTGGNLVLGFMEGWQNEIARVKSPGGLILRSGGDVKFGDYEGASLHVLAGGRVIGRDVTITDPSTAQNSLNEYIVLSDGRTGIQIDGKSQSTLDIRAGIFIPNIDSQTTEKKYNIDLQKIVIEEGNGMVFIKNYFGETSNLKEPMIKIDSIYNNHPFESGSQSLARGVVAIDSIGSILTGGISASSNYSNLSNRDIYGGMIVLLSGHDIDTSLGKISTAASYSIGGEIRIESRGDIKTQSLSSGGGLGTAGNITVISRDGKVDTTGGEIEATARGIGGTIYIEARNDVQTGSISTGGNDGPTKNSKSDIRGIQIVSQNGNIDTTKGMLNSTSYRSGDIRLDASQDIATGSIVANGGNPFMPSKDYIPYRRISREDRDEGSLSSGSIEVHGRSFRLISGARVSATPGIRDLQTNNHANSDSG